MRVALDFPRPAFTSGYEVAGRFVLLDISESSTRAAVENFLQRWHLKPVSTEGRQPDATIIFEVGDLAPVPVGFEGFAIPGNAKCFATDTAHEIRFDNAVITADESRIVRVRLTRPLEPASEFFPELVSYALSAALRRCSVFELHSGAITNGSDGKSILICGPSGSGKSTLTLQFVAAGWSYLSDDVLLLRTDGNFVDATGLRRFFALTAETMSESGLPQVSSLMANRSLRSPKMRVAPEDVFPNSTVHECRPNIIFFPTITGSATSLTRELSPTETMSCLIRLCPWSVYDRAIARDFLDCLAKLVKQCESYDLLAGRDLMGDPAHTVNFLTSVLKNQSK
jgi:hypothetical protein